MPSASSRRQATTLALIGETSSALTTATTARRFGAFFATTATSPWGTAKQPKSFSPPLSTYEITRDVVVEVSEGGIEDVFDVQIDRTENFIANGLVSHNTRWHQQDLAGGILPEDWQGESGAIRCRDGKVWHVICLPAEAERADDPLGRKVGERLWPQWFTADHFATFKKQLRTWSALFQQRPTDPEGMYYRRAWFKTITRDRVPELVREVRCWDLAATAESEAEDPDWLAGVKIGRGTDGKYYVLHVYRDRLTPEGVGKTLKSFGETDGRDVAIRVEQEGAASGKIVKYHYERMMDGWDCRFTGIPRHSKLTRSGPFNAACERGDVILVKGDWNDAFLDELQAFPHGKHDDQQDAAVGAYTELTAGLEPWERKEWHEVVSYADHEAGDDGGQVVSTRELLMRNMRGGQ